MDRTYFTTVDTPIGPLTLVANDTELVRVIFEDGDLPEGAVGIRTPLLAEAARQLEDYFAGTRATFNLPLARLNSGFFGTAQAALEHIPYGEQWTYAQLADAAGNPRAVRPAGSACATNPFPVIVPCHRVIRSDGNMGAYLGGEVAKRWLLDFEARNSGNLSPQSTVQRGMTDCNDSTSVTTNQTATGLILCEDGLARPAWAARDELMRHYYDTEWGMPVRTEQGVYERLCLEGFQSGLSWATVLRKRDNFRSAFAGFDPDIVAGFDDTKVDELMGDAGIIRNRRKILAVITNARATVALRPAGGLAQLVWSFKPESTPEPRSLEEIPSTSPESTALAEALKKAGFSFVGPTTVFALMEAIGIVDTHLVGSHRRGSSGVWA